jgi:hypothetical protein
MIFFFKIFSINGKEPEPQFVILAPASGDNLISAPAPQHCFYVKSVGSGLGLQNDFSGSGSDLAQNAPDSIKKKR